MRKLRKLLMGMSAAALLASSAHAATSITVAATPALANTLADLAADFSNLYPTLSYNVAVVVNNDANLRDDIVAGGTTGPYDLFLSESALLPLQLVKKYPTIAPGPVFPFARDTLVLYSASTPVDISRGFPSRNVQQFSLPDPSTLDPWGVAASQVLIGNWAALIAYRQGLGSLVTDVAASYAGAEYLNLAYTFTGKSQICTVFNGVEQYEEGTYHHEYKLGRDYFNDIVLAGVKIASATRTAAQETELSAFIDFLTGVGTTLGTTGLTNHCFSLPK